MNKKDLKILLVFASIGIFVFACLTSIFTITYYKQKVQCLYDGVTYDNGDKFLSTDGCNSCACSNGEVACTLRACLKDGSGKGNHLPMKGIEIYCYEKEGQMLYSILPGTNRLKTYDEIVGNNSAVSSPVSNFINKTHDEAVEVLMYYYGYTQSTASNELDTCTPAERLK